MKKLECDHLYNNSNRRNALLIIRVKIRDFLTFLNHVKLT